MAKSKLEKQWVGLLSQINQFQKNWSDVDPHEFDDIARNLLQEDLYNLEVSVTELETLLEEQDAK